jgi:ATP-dependent helicase/nuclease subunit A
VVDRGPDGYPPAIGSVRPGLHQPRADGPPVAWWDPAALALEVEENVALRHQRILEVDDGITAAASEQNYAAWKTEREGLLARASQPSMRVQTVTSLARAEAAKASKSEGEVEDYVIRAHPQVHVETVQRGDFERPGGRRFGALVHALLGSIDLDASADTLQASAAINGRIVTATEEEVQAAIVTVGTALGHPILRRAAASAGKNGLRRETPVL